MENKELDKIVCLFVFTDEETHRKCKEYVVLNTDGYICPTAQDFSTKLMALGSAIAKLKNCGNFYVLDHFYCSSADVKKEIATMEKNIVLRKTNIYKGLYSSDGFGNFSIDEE